MRKHPFDSTKVVQMHPAGNFAASSDTDMAAMVDVSGWEYATIIVNAGALEGAVTVDYEEFATDVVGSATAVSGAQITFLATEDNTVKAMVINLRDKQKFGSVRVQNGAGVGGSDLGVTMVLSRPIDTTYDKLSTDEPVIAVD